MSSGLITLVGANGTSTTLTVTRPGGHSQTDTITISAPATLDHLDYTLSSSSATVGSSAPTGTVTKWQDSGETTPFTGPVSLSYASSDTGVATINSSTGVITLVAAGSCTFTVTDSISSTTATTGTLTVSASGNVYDPQAGDRILIDTRAGGANDLQSVTITGTNSTDLAAAKAKFPDQLYDGSANLMSRFILNTDLGAKVFAHDARGFAYDTLTQAVTAVATTATGAITGSGTAQSIAVTSSTGFSVGDWVHIDGPKALYPNQYIGSVGGNGCPWERVQITAIADGTHISGAFTLNHASGAVVAKEQTVTVTSSTFAQTGRTIGVGYASANQEVMFCYTKGTGTITGGFAKSHANGERMAYPRDMSVGKLQTYFPPNHSQSGSRPRDLFFRFKHRMGKTANDAGGFGATDTRGLYCGYSDYVENFDASQSHSNAGRKFILVEREVWDAGGLDRVGLLWGGNNGAYVNPNYDTDSPSSTNSAQFGSPSPSFNPSTLVAHVAEHTLRFTPETSKGANDGALAWWVSVDGGAVTQLANLTGLGLAPSAFDRIEVLPTGNAIQEDVTEYTWDYLAWERPWVGTVPPSQPSGPPTFVSATSSSITFNVHVPQNCDTLRFYYGGTVLGLSQTPTAPNTMGSDITVTSADWGTTKSVTVTGLTGATTYTQVCHSAGLSGKFGTQSAGLSSAATS